MAEFTLKLNGMSCGSCERLIQRVAEAEEAGVKEIDAKSGFATFVCAEGRLEPLKQALALKGFTECAHEDILHERGNWASVGKYCNSLVFGNGRLEVERNLLKYAFGSFAMLAILSGAGYFLFTPSIPPSYLPLIPLAIAGSVLVTFSHFHMYFYRKGLSCTNGMMIGMTMGMIAGFMFGALIGATNGMFIGSVAGMAVGIGLGMNLGRFCGVMGAMEGIMAGIMSGLMGAMTSIMMLYDNLLAMLYILFALCAIVTGGLSYMMYREAGAAQVKEYDSSFIKFLGMSLAIFFATALMALIGPKGPITYI